MTIHITPKRSVTVPMPVILSWLSGSPFLSHRSTGRYAERRPIAALVSWEPECLARVIGAGRMPI